MSMRSTISQWLIVLFFIAIFAAVLTPKRREATDRAKVSRVRSDLSEMSRALEAYYVDHNAYPGMVPLKNFAKDPQYNTDGTNLGTWDVRFSALEKADGQHLHTIDPGLTIPGVAGLTTPVAYCASLLPDPCMNFLGETRIPYAYHGYPKAEDPGWILFSPGPDQDYDIDNPPAFYNPETKWVSKRLRYNMNFGDNIRYETNNGDVFRIKEAHMGAIMYWQSDLGVDLSATTGSQALDGKPSQP